MNETKDGWTKAEDAMSPLDAIRSALDLLDREDSLEGWRREALARFNQLLIHAGCRVVLVDYSDAMALMEDPDRFKLFVTMARSAKPLYSAADIAWAVFEYDGGDDV